MYNCSIQSLTWQWWEAAATLLGYIVCISTSSECSRTLVRWSWLMGGWSRTFFHECKAEELLRTYVSLPVFAKWFSFCLGANSGRNLPRNAVPWRGNAGNSPLYCDTVLDESTRKPIIPTSWYGVAVGMLLTLDPYTRPSRIFITACESLMCLQYWPPVARFISKYYSTIKLTPTSRTTKSIALKGHCNAIKKSKWLPSPPGSDAYR